MVWLEYGRYDVTNFPQKATFPKQPMNYNETSFKERKTAIPLIPRRTILEFAIITLLGLLYITLFPARNVSDNPRTLELLIARPDVRQDGLEHERLSGVLLPVEIGLRKYGHIPTWNPYVGVGEPVINNPFNYLFNPFASLPILLFGGVQGSKIATALALLIAGYSMWALGKAVGIGTVGRVTAGTLYLMSGGIIAKFHAGHFQLGLSLAWMPLVFAGLWWTLHSQDRRAPVLMAVAFALMFFAGNIYYTLHTLVCSLFIVLIHLVERQQNGWRFRSDRLRRVMLGAAFAFGLAALQFMPVWAVRDYIRHGGDPGLESRYNMGQALANFVLPWEEWSIFEEAVPKMLVAVDYAYIGAAVFLLIVAGTVVSLANNALRRRFPAWTALILAVAMMVWGAGQTPLLQELYANIPRLAEFRFVGRAHSVAALWWILLAGISVDMLWRTSAFSSRGSETRRLIRVTMLGGLAWTGFVFYSLQNDAGRAALLLYDYQLRAALDSVRFITFLDAAQGLFALILIAMALDTVLLVASNVLSHLRSKRTSQLKPLEPGVYITRLFRFGVLAIAIVAISDIMQVNSRLMVFNHREADFGALYPYVHANDPEMFPAVTEPFSPFAFSAYNNEVRNWFLSEGWTPSAPPSIIPVEAGVIRDLPRWAIVWNEESARPGSERFVTENGYEPRQCTSTNIANYLVERCNLDAPGAVVLYELADALPYTFVVPARTLLTESGEVHGDNVLPAEVVSHLQDTIVIEAEQPATSAYLVVQETNFPGWLAFVDGVPVQTVSIGRFIGVPTIEGRHRYTLRFEPPGLIAGVVIFIATIVAIVLYLKAKSTLVSSH
jgi:hypothetical protein